MVKNSKKAKTYIEKMGYKDYDLETPEHDYLMMWFSKRENMIDVFSTIFRLNVQFQCVHKRGRLCCRTSGMPECTYNQLRDPCKGYIPLKTKICDELEKIQLTKPDLYYQTRQIEFEKAIVHNNFVAGFCDAYIVLKGQMYKNLVTEELSLLHGYILEETEVLVEFKTSVKSVGELLREFRFYESHFKKKFSLVMILLTFEDVKLPHELLLRQNIYIYQIPRPERARQNLMQFFK